MHQLAPGGVVAAKLRMPQPAGLDRERLARLLAPLWDHRLGLVVAPAGAGKTTLLAHFASGTETPTAWYRAEASDAEAQSVLACLERALCAVLPGLPSGWRSVEEAANALEAWSGDRVLLVVDDLHVLQGTPAEAVLERLVQYAPPAVRMLTASRAAPAFNLSRMRVAGQLLEVGADDLRFRSWEAECLFRDVYREQLSPEDLAELTRRTEGWAAGLQLFHLATAGRRHDERRKVLAGLNTPARFVREYLAGNVLDQLPERLRRFLVDTCVLGRLSGPLCDAFLQRSGSAQILEELERRQIFTSAIDADGWYRYHEVLRSHLEAVLVERVGEGDARVRHRHAGAVLEEWGALHEALAAYCRGEDWEAAGRLVGHEGEQLALDPGGWLDLLPPALLDQDPWILLATARRQRAAGRWAEAVESYRRAEGAFADRRARDLCRRERRSLTGWQEPVLVHSGDWLGIVRAATTREPLVAATRALGQEQRAPARLAAGLALLLAGHCRHAQDVLQDAATLDDASPLLAVGARIGAAAAALLAGDDGASAAEQAADDAERLGAPWLAAVARALLALSDRPGGGSEAALLRLSAERSGDPWGQHLAALLEGLSVAGSARVRPDRLEQAAVAFNRLGAGVLEAWCRAARALALAVAGDGAAADTARAADGFARGLGVPGARVLAARALVLADSAGAGDHQVLVHSLEAECGLAREATTEPAPPPAPVLLRLFGSFRLVVDGVAADLSTARPRARAVLRLLALQAGRSVHREVIIAALWPEADLDAGARHLHVAVSSLRRLLPEPVAISRDGEAYRLVLPEGAVVDVHVLDRAAADAKRAASAGDARTAIQALERAVELHDGELLSEDGPAEWVIGPREHYRAVAVQAAHELADLHLRQRAAAEAAAACERGLCIDRYRDGLWRTLVAAYTAAGDRAAAAYARRRYDEVLAVLGIRPVVELDVPDRARVSVSSGTRSR
jgi:DNA-binding SARP family transcriptional activator